MATPQPTVTWDERIRGTLEREGTEDAFWRVTDDDPDFPYWFKYDVELCHLEFMQRTLLTMPKSEIETVGPFGIVLDVVHSGDAMPQNILKCLTAAIDPNGSGKYWPASGPMAAEEWYQIAALGAGDYNAYTIIGGQVFFKGNTMKLYYLAEPVLSVFRNDELATPAAAYLELGNSWVHQQLMAADWLPIGRA